MKSSKKTHTKQILLGAAFFSKLSAQELFFTKIPIPWEVHRINPKNTKLSIKFLFLCIKKLTWCDLVLEYKLLHMYQLQDLQNEILF